MVLFSCRVVKGFKARYSEERSIKVNDLFQSGAVDFSCLYEKSLLEILFVLRLLYSMNWVSTVHRDVPGRRISRNMVCISQDVRCTRFEKKLACTNNRVAVRLSPSAECKCKPMDAFSIGIP